MGDVYYGGQTPTIYLPTGQYAAGPQVYDPPAGLPYAAHHSGPEYTAAAHGLPMGTPLVDSFTQTGFLNPPRLRELPPIYHHTHQIPMQVSVQQIPHPAPPPATHQITQRFQPAPPPPPPEIVHQYVIPPPAPPPPTVIHEYHPPPPPPPPPVVLHEFYPPPYPLPPCPQISVNTQAAVYPLPTASVQYGRVIYPF